MVQKQYAFSRNYTFNFFSNTSIMQYILSCDAGQHQQTACTSQPHIHKDKQPIHLWPFYIQSSCSSLSVQYSMGFPGGSTVKNPLAMQEIQKTWAWSLGQEDSLEEGMAADSSILAWDRGPWWAPVHWVTKSRIQLNYLSTHACIIFNKLHQIFNILL